MSQKPTSIASSIDFTYDLKPLSDKAGYKVWRHEMELVLRARCLERYIRTEPGKTSFYNDAEDAQAQLILYKYLHKDIRIELQEEEPDGAYTLWHMLSSTYDSQVVEQRSGKQGFTLEKLVVISFEISDCWIGISEEARD